MVVVVAVVVAVVAAAGTRSHARKYVPTIHVTAFTSPHSRLVRRAVASFRHHDTCACVQRVVKPCKQEVVTTFYSLPSIFHSQRQNTQASPRACSRLLSTNNQQLLTPTTPSPHSSLTRNSAVPPADAGRTRSSTISPPPPRPAAPPSPPSTLLADAARGALPLGLPLICSCSPVSPMTQALPPALARGPGGAD